MVTCGSTVLMLNCLSGMTTRTLNNSRGRQWVQAIGGSGPQGPPGPPGQTISYNFIEPIVHTLVMRFLLILNLLTTLPLNHVS